MSVGDVSKSVAYLATFAGQKSILPPDYFKKLAAMKPSFLVRSEQIAGRVVSGEDIMAFSGMPTRAYQYNQKGAKLKFMLPQEGVVLLPQDSGKPSAVSVQPQEPADTLRRHGHDG